MCLFASSIRCSDSHFQAFFTTTLLKNRERNDSCVANVNQADALRKTAAIMRVGNSQIGGYEGKNIKQLSSIYLDPGSEPWNADKGGYLIWQWQYIYLLNEE